MPTYAIKKTALVGGVQRKPGEPHLVLTERAARYHVMAGELAEVPAQPPAADAKDKPPADKKAGGRPR